MIPFDFFRRAKLEFVRKEHESGDIWSFYFKPSHKLKHIAGQHGLFILPGFRGLHIFSLASAPDEELVMIGTHVREGSKYKQYLAAMEPGQKITMHGPVLNFVLPRRPSHVVFLAQGIGITPFRSMIMHNQVAMLHTPITLIHVDSEAHTYRAFNEGAVGESYFVANADEFGSALVDTVAKLGDNALYYTSGSPKFNAATAARLKALGIPGAKIKKDGFLGY